MNMTQKQERKNIKIAICHTRLKDNIKNSAHIDLTCAQFHGIYVNVYQK